MTYIFLGANKLNMKGSVAHFLFLEWQANDLCIG